MGKVGWKDISTFLALASRTGPIGKGWLKHMIITNVNSVCWKGNKTKKDFTYARKTFMKCNNMFWIKFLNDNGMCSLSKSVNENNTHNLIVKEKQSSKIVFDSESEDEDEPGLIKEKVEVLPKNTESLTKNVRELRLKWLNSLK